MKKICLGIMLLLVTLGYAGEVTISELLPGARENTEPYFQGNPRAVEMTITQQTYKTTPQGNLFTRIYAPANRISGKKHPCAVFFSGGGWKSGSLLQFGKHCEYLASKRFVAMTPQYRVENVHGTTPRDAVEDAISCIRWVRSHADELGIDPDRIVVGGGSAGGHLAAATATLTKIHSETDDLSVSCRPNLLVLFNPVVNTASNALAEEYFNKISAYWEVFSPMHNMQSKMPPTVISHGLEDSSVPVWTVREYAKDVEKSGAVCELYLYPGQKHGFFNGGDGENPYFYDTMYRMGLFLAEQGYMAPEGH